MARVIRKPVQPSGPGASDGAALLRRLFPPMLATLSDGPPKDSGEWLLELKYDGFRATAAIGGGKVTLWSRNKLDLSSRFPEVTKALARKSFPEAVLDGEIVSLDEDGAPSFQRLQQGEVADALFFVFDLLWLEGHDLRGRPLEERRELLEKLLRKLTVRAKNGPLRLAEQVEGPPAEALARVSAQRYEGLIAKRRRSKYENRRSREWIKLKGVNTQELAVVGYTPSTSSARELGALLLGVAVDDGFRYAGKVGTGFSARQLAELKQEFSSDRIDRSPLLDPPRIKNATWVTPRLVAQIQFTEWTGEGRLRHPAFLGLRPDKSPKECVREMPGRASPPALPLPSPTTRTSPRPDSPIVLTHPERVLYPRDGFTKQDVFDYYSAVAAPMLLTLAGRPLTLEHWNQGIDAPSWFHQNITTGVKSWMHLVETPARTKGKMVRHLVADRIEALHWLAQNSVLTVHMWSSREKSLERPDWVVFDLDPAEGKGIGQAIDTAIVLRRLFDELELPSVPKTSGKRGIHLFVPLVSRYSHEEAIAFAGRLAETVASKLPYTTVERSLASRAGRLYLDWMQNGYGKTVVAPYSLRAIDGAPVSAPLKWSEVNHKLTAAKFNLRSMPERLAKVGDLFAAAFENGAKLPRLAG